MSRTFEHLKSGDELYVASVEDGNCNLNCVTIETIETLGIDGGNYKITGTADGHDLILHQLFESLYVLLDESRPDDERDIFPALGVAECSHEVAWEIILSLLLLEFSPTEAVDFVALEFAGLCTHTYANIRQEAPTDLQNCVDETVSELEEI